MVLLGDGVRGAGSGLDSGSEMIAPAWPGGGNAALPAAFGRRRSGAMVRSELPAATRCVVFSALPKKKSLFERIGPPKLPPYWATMFRGLLGVVWNTLRARKWLLVS